MLNTNFPYCIFNCINEHYGGIPAVCMKYHALRRNAHKPSTYYSNTAHSSRKLNSTRQMNMNAIVLCGIYVFLYTRIRSSNLIISVFSIADIPTLYFIAFLAQWIVIFISRIPIYKYNICQQFCNQLLMKENKENH